MIKIQILKSCGKSICRPLELIFNECILNLFSTSKWKNGNVVPIYKKNDRQCLEKYRTVSLIPICSKILERLIFNEMFSFLNLEITVLTNFCLFHMRYTNRSMMGLMLKVSL